MSDSTLQADDSGDLLAGVASGALAYVVGYVLTFVLVRSEVRRLFEQSVPDWKGVAWFYYNAHFVNVLSDRSAGPFEETQAVSLIAESGSSTATFLYVVPPLVLLAAGAGAALYVDASDLRRAARTGAASVVGYGVPAVALAVLSTHTASGAVFGVEVQATISVVLSSAVVLAALLYPGVLATTGAVLGARLRPDAGGGRL